MQSFRAEAGFLASLDKACRDFMNRNKATGTSSSKSPELLAKHADGMLRKSNKTTEEAGLEDALNQIMIVFKYIEDKDVFQKFYSKMLARRLVHFTSASDDAEASMISKLKEACGFEYTNKLQRMFTDMGLSKELNDSFKESQQNNETSSDLDFYVLVLANGFWPLTGPSTEFIIPTELLEMYKRFERYYQGKHSGRKLNWLWQLSKNDVKTNYLSQKLIFQTSTYQTSVLLQFNSSESLTEEDLAKGTGLNEATLKPILGLFVKLKVMLREGDAYSLNKDFKSKKMRINLNLQTKTEQKTESSEVMKTVDEDRKMLLQATIVRIMKARKQLRHAQLIRRLCSKCNPASNPRFPTSRRPSIICWTRSTSSA
ncbi:hypothetical protein IEQ34_025236 [Dendrobium chrysotoxum]|uniref:Cullin family profile domain-containing protein n=1 Tax=Dendrobium chrysotoxum TaxID=161865 RepID=A0AAV7FQ46_DENCH|nr:hypothetical protein IEQ34_025236 [Dendrobium chrysotoxum]